MTIEETFTEVSFVLAFAQATFMLICNFFLWKNRNEYPISYRNIYILLTHNGTAMFLNFYFFTLLNFDLPDGLSVWPQFFLWTLYVGSHIVDTFRLYCMFRISSARYLSASISSTEEEGNQVASGEEGQSEQALKKHRFQDWILAQQELLFDRLTYVKLLALLVSITTIYGLIAEIAYTYDQSLEKLWRVPIIALIVMLFVSSTAMNIVLRHTHDSSGLKTEYRYISIFWLLLIGCALAYYVSIWAGVIDPVFFGFRKVLFIAIFLPTYIFSGLLPVLKVREHRSKLYIYNLAQKQSTIKNVLQNKELSDAFAQYLVGLFHPIDFQFVRAAHECCREQGEMSLALVMKVSRKFLDPERPTAISLIQTEAHRLQIAEIYKRIEEWGDRVEDGHDVPPTETMRNIFNDLTSVIIEKLEREQLPNFYCSPQYKRYYERNQVRYAADTIAQGVEAPARAIEMV